MKRYNPNEIEPKWQKIWQETGVYTADLHSNKPKYIGMSMFNYPSGNLHIGHAMNYTISDVKARFKRQQGFESYHPVGWDSFGLPAENYAIKAGISPQESMGNLIPDYHEKYKAMGWSNDWEKEISTHTPEYYKWTQWLFVKMHEAGMAYQEPREQWWCNQCQTVLADAQVLDGKCWRHDGADDPLVEKKEIKQWFFKITDYADEMLEATKDLDWTNSVKLAQQNWIGRSEGAIITYEVEGSKEQIRTFTTAYDTIYGTTFIVLAPENELVEEFTTEENKESVKNYVDTATRKSEVERQANKEKTGVFTGSYAINPVNGSKMPVWVADYVLIGYGTGAVMGVPGEDERDFEFANKFELPIVYTTDRGEFTNYQLDIKPSPEKYTMANSGEFNGMNFKEAKPKILDKLVSEAVAEPEVNYKMRDWSVARQRYWGAPVPVVNCEDCGPVVLKEEDLPIILPELADFKPSGDGRSALARAKDWLEVECPKPGCTGKAERETDTLDTYVCSSWYMIRYFDPHNQQEPFDKEVAKKWMPIDFYNGADHATAHLLYARFITRFLAKQGYLDDPEPFKNFLFNGKVTAEDGTMFSKSKGNGVDPLEIINSGYGADALRMYLMFAGPLEQWTAWSPQGVPGTHRFLTRLWNIVQEYIEIEKTENDSGDELLKIAAKTTKKVTDDLESSQYNTAIAACMGMLNDLQKVKEKSGFSDKNWQNVLETLVMLVAPFAPHIADELWLQLGHSDSVNKDHWPELDEAMLVDDTINIVVQVNGKVRANIEVPADISEEDLVKLATEEKNVSAHIEGKDIRKTIVVPGKLVSIVA